MILTITHKKVLVINNPGFDDDNQTTSDHDGLQTIQGPDGLNLPLALTIRQRFLFEIRILPVNDPPRLTGDSTCFSLL